MGESKELDELHPGLLPKGMMSPTADVVKRALLMGFRATPERLAQLEGRLQQGSRTDVKCSQCLEAITLSPASLKMLEMGATAICEVCADVVAQTKAIHSVQSPEHVLLLAIHKKKLAEKDGNN